MKNLYIKQIDVVADEKNNAVPSIIFSEFVNELSDLNEEFSNFRDNFTSFSESISCCFINN